MTTFLIGAAMFLVGCFIGIIGAAFLAANKKPGYHLIGAIEWLRSLDDPDKMMYLLVRHLYGGKRHIHKNVERKLRAIA